MSRINYTELKKAIIKSAKGVEKGSAEFVIDMNKLKENCAIAGLVPVVLENEVKSHNVSVTDVITLAEFFKGQKLSWIDSDKQTITLLFVPIDCINDTVQDILNTVDVYDTNRIAKLIAKYPCYTTAIISYISNEPKRFGKPSYEIKCRANSVALKLNAKDDTTTATEAEEEQ